MDKNNEFYREIKSTNRVTPAEATIAWFYSGRKQPLIDVESRHAVYADGVYDCTAQIQRSIDDASCIYLPQGLFVVKSTLSILGDTILEGEP